MKRSSELAPLSRDHHQALGVALRLRRATAEDVDAAVAGFLDFWRREGERHFASEEQVLLPALPEQGTWATATARIRDEHEQIRARAAALVEAPQLEAAHVLGKLLQEHVRYEERHVFEYVEKQLSAEALVRLGRELDAR